MKKLGLDLGSSSIGWALREGTEITRKGVITFQAGMMKGQTGGYSSPTKDRREARSKRRLVQARKYRKWALLEILLDEFVPLSHKELEVWSKYRKGQVQKFPENDFFLKWLACDFTYEGGMNYDNPYELRVKALDFELTKHEFGRALYHLVQRRGYKDIGESDKETEKQIERREGTGFNDALKSNRTIAEALTKDFLDKGQRARNQYPYREEYRDELEQICKGQGYDTSKNEKGEYNNEFVKSLWKAIIWQRPLRTQKGNIGKCTLEPTKQRCPVSNPVFEIFRAWSFINTIKYYDENMQKQSLSSDFRNQLFDFFLKKDKNFKFEEIRIFLDKLFKSKKKYNYPIDNKTAKYDTTVSGMPICKGLIEVLGNDQKEAISVIHNYNIGDAPKNIYGYSTYDLWHVLFEFDEIHLKDFAIHKLKIDNENNKKGEEFNPFVKLKNNITTGYSDLSLKAICKIIPFLKEGYLYNEAVVLAKIPGFLGEKWKKKKETIFENVKKSNELYNWSKTVIGITNALIDQYKGLEHDEKFAYKNFEYILDNDDINDIEKVCQGHFGEKTWENKTNKNQIIAEVKEKYQAFFNDSKRTYREVPLLINIFKEKLKVDNVEIQGTLYHHSDRKNIYGTTTKIKDKDKGVELEILPEPRINSIKNPMLNKSMSILRKLINTLIIKEIIDSETEIVIEVARELNDNNKRAAIERYQNERRNNREKYRDFLNEFKENGKNINVEKSISAFELWTEQIFEDTVDDKGDKVTNKNNNDILREKEAVRRYELWMEQKGQCMYTGKMISISHLFSNEIDVEHTIPRSLLPDNTMANETVCFARYNRDVKKNRIPFLCENYSKNIEKMGTAILPRLESWVQKRDNYKKQYEDRVKSRGNEDEDKKNKRIQEKHYFKMHYDYWKDKIERFEADEVRDSWARRQLVDTQLVSKYSREFLKTYFKKVAVQKGSVTADYRKIYSFQEEDEIKSRNRHTHHAIDAAVLTLIPVNSSHRDKILKKMYEKLETEKKQYTIQPFTGFNSQKLINDIDNTTLIVNYENDKILKQSYRNVRKRGKLQYLKDKQGKFVLDKDEVKILLKSRGDTVRSTLFAATYLAKIKDVERDANEQPQREGVEWKYKTGKDEFIFVKRDNIDKIKFSEKLIEAIVDPVIKKLVRDQKNNTIVKDYQGNIIRHVRIKTSTGKEVKQRINYQSKHDYKNKFYSEAGSLPFAILIQKSNNGEIVREMIPIASFEVAKMNKKSGRFDVEQYIKQHYPYFVDYPDKKLLKVGQKVMVLNYDEEYEKRNDVDFQTKRLYVITQFSEGSIWLKYHLESQSKDQIKDMVSMLKDNLLRKCEISLDIPEVIENMAIQDNKERKNDYDNRKFRFDNINTSFRLKIISEKIGLEKTKEVKNELDKFKAISGSIEIDGKTPLLKMSSKNWNFLYEGLDFDVSILGIFKERK